MGSLMDDAKIVPTPAPVPATDASEPDMGQTLLVRRKSPSRAVIAFVSAALIVAVVGVWLASRIFGGNDATAIATEVPHAVEAKADKPAAPVAGTSPAACQGDLSQASEQKQWYCNGFMPWKQAVDREIGSLKERGSDSTSILTWIPIVALIANGILTWIMVLRRRKSA